MGRSTGLIFAHFPDKESLWRAAMGTPPPVDSALTRAAPHLLEMLEALLKDRQALVLNEAGAEELWKDAQRAVRAARSANPGAGLSGEFRSQDFPAKRLSRFGAHVTGEVESRRDPPLWKDIMETTYFLCGRLMAYAERKATEAEVYEAAVSAGATIAHVAIHGAADVPYRTTAGSPAKARPAAGKTLATKQAASAP